MYKIICVKHSKGSKEDRLGVDYDNHNFFCLTDEVSKNLVCGTNVQIVKCNTASFDAVVAARHLNVSSFEGSILEPVFNQYGKMVDFKVTPAE